MKVIYFAHSVLSRGGDKMILAHLGHLAAAGHQVVIRANIIDTVFTIYPAITIEKPRICSKLGTLISALIEKQRADCIIASIVPTAVFLSLRNRCRVVHFAQDDNETAYSSPLLRYAMNFLYLLSFSLLSIPTITVSPDLAATFKKKYGVNCRVVSNGVDTGVFFPSPSADLLAIKGGRKSILLLSRNDPRKGFDIARQVVAQLARISRVPFEVWTVGEEMIWSDFPGIHRHFGFLHEGELRSLMSSADVFFYPSRHEGFGLMVLEAFASACPVVTSAAVTYARNNENALVSGIEDVDSLTGQVMKILEDEQLAKKIATGGYRFAQENLLAESSVRFENEISLFVNGSLENV